MKKFFVSALMTLLSILNTSAQKAEIENIKAVITGFSKAGDQNDAQKLASYVDDNFRIVMNRLFGSPDVVVMPKSVYLAKIESKEFGGDQRVLKIENVIVNENSASAKVVSKGAKMTVVSLVLLIKDAVGKWKLLSDVPTIK